MEEEYDHQITFLDVLARREECRMSTSVYHKWTHTDRHLNFYSHHHHKVLSSAVKCLRNRVFCVCDSSCLSQESQHLHKTFQANSFPQRQDNQPHTEEQVYQHSTITQACHTGSNWKEHGRKDDPLLTLCWRPDWKDRQSIQKHQIG